MLLKPIQRKFAVLTGGKIAEGERTESRAMKGEHFASLAREHAAHLVVFAFGEDKFGFTRVSHRQRGGRAGLFFVFERKGAAGEEFVESGGWLAIEGRVIRFGDFVLRRGEPVDELALIGEEQQAAGVFVESADRGDHGIARPPTFREQRIDIGSVAFFVRTDQAERFIEDQEEPVGMIKWLAIDQHIGRIDLGRGIFERLVLSGDFVGF